MELQPDSLAKQKQLDLLHEQLEAVSKNLREERGILNRDWPHIAPRERSSRSRQVKELEEKQRALEEQIEMNRE